MKLIIKSAAEIELMRVAGKLAAEALTMIGEHVKPGVTTEELDRICHDYIVNEQKAIPACLNYKGFPKSICTSVNHQVCHGIPSNRILRDGDIINIDITVIKDEFHGDTSKMFVVGNKKNRLAQRLMHACRESMFEGIRLVKPGTNLLDIGDAIYKYATNAGFVVVKEYCGHGIGRQFHEDLQILSFKPSKKSYAYKEMDIELVPGMTFTVEPILNAGREATKTLPDGWTVVTCDHSLSAQWEHTVLVTETGYEILTLRDEEKDEVARFFNNSA